MFSKKGEVISDPFYHLKVIEHFCENQKCSLGPNLKKCKINNSFFWTMGCFGGECKERSANWKKIQNIS